MGFRNVPTNPFAGLNHGVLETSLRLIAGRRPVQPAVEETEFPAIDVYETPDELVVEAELPGVDVADIGVSAGESQIVIEGLKREEPGPGRVNFLCMERSFGAFRRVVLAGATVDLVRATASFRDGLLQVRAPKIDEKRGRVRTIPVIPANPDANGERSEP